MEVSKKVEKTMLLDCSTARYKMSIRPPRKHADARMRDQVEAVVNGTQGLVAKAHCQALLRPSAFVGSSTSRN